MSSPDLAATGTRTLSEAASKQLLARFGVPFVEERLVSNPADAVRAAQELGVPVVAKLCGDRLAHKTERGLVRLGLADDAAVLDAATELLALAHPDDGVTGVLVAPMLSGSRELIAGVATDPQFGPTVLVGLGGVLTEALADVSVRLAPLGRIDAEEMLDDLRCQALLGEVRGEPALDRTTVIDVLVGLSAAVEGVPELVSVDLNPLIVHDGRAVAVDALVELRAQGAPS
ncbi:MAG: acetate--CoA ligase family protein [Actinobacteria bacterium]|nr:acetate--CoA ligase family protein [Actinomycetota bacterium]